MIRFLADENASGPDLGGIIRFASELDVLTVRDVGLQATDDRIILAWAAEQNRVVLTNDRKTMIGFAKDRVLQSLKMPGLVVLPLRGNRVQLASDLIRIAFHYEVEEVKNQVIFLPLR